MEWGEPDRLDVDGISVDYGPGLPPALEDVSLRVPHGSRVAVVGPNGSGKSTLFKALVGLRPLRRGRISIHGLPLGSHQDCVAYVPQREEVDWRFPVTVTDVVSMGRYGRAGWLRRLSAEDRAVVAGCIERLGLQAVAARPIGELSGGQQQRVFLARALAQEPHVLLMDEPFTGVDAGTQEAVLALLDELQSQRVTVLVSTHDLSLARERFDLVVLLNRRLVAYGAPETVFLPEHLAQAFGGQALLVNGTVVVDQCCGHGEDLRRHGAAGTGTGGDDCGCGRG